MSLTLRDALDADMARLGIDQKGLAAALREGDDDRAIDTSAISNWKQRGVIPRRRERKLLEILGAGSKTAEFMAQAWQVPRAPRLPTYPLVVTDAVARPSQPPQTPPTTEDSAKDYGHAYQVEKAAPEWMVSHFNSPVRYMLGGYRNKFDYISPNVVADVRYTSHQSAVAYYRNLVRLAAVRAHQDAHKVFGIVLINSEGNHNSVGQDRFTAEAHALQVRAAWVNSAHDAVRVLEVWEKGLDHEEAYQD